MGNILGYGDHTVFVTTIQHCQVTNKADMDCIQTSKQITGSDLLVPKHLV